LFKNLKLVFGYNDFKSEIQKRACIEIAKFKDDCYVSLPTGKCV
jgi:hypothetical protein